MTEHFVCLRACVHEDEAKAFRQSAPFTPHRATSPNPFTSLSRCESDSPARPYTYTHARTNTIQSKVSVKSSHAGFRADR